MSPLIETNISLNYLFCNGLIQKYSTNFNVQFDIF